MIQLGSMKIALVGFGKMGQEVQNLIDQSGKHEVVSVSYRTPTDGLDKEGIAKADVVIDFTSPEIILETIKEITKMGKNMVIGTTGWYDRTDEVKEIVEKSGTGLVYGSNFSIGANIFFKIIAYASSLFKKFEGYEAYGLEIHHKAKKDAPSGTALRIGKEAGGLQFTSIRAGRNPGFHQVVFDSNADSITLSHAAHNRQGFAAGAILAAEFIKDRKGFFSFDEVFK